MVKETTKASKTAKAKTAKAKTAKKEKRPDFFDENFKKAHDIVKGYCSVPENLKERIMTSIVLIPFVIIAIYSSKFLFNGLILLLVTISAFEWRDMTKTSYNKKFWLFLGLSYIVIPFLLLITIRDMQNGANIVLWMLGVVWATDIAGMFVGRSLKGPKLAPKISPNKTWSGLIGGVICAMMIGFISSFMFAGGIKFFVFFSGLLAVVEQIGDLFESKIKRHFGVKDSGDILPGHGGILDRIDGLLFVIPTVALFALLSWGKLF
jgi:phosphatidate cytidylyltransferase